MGSALLASRDSLKTALKNRVVKVVWRTWGSSASDTFSLLLATLAGVWLDSLFSDIATWSGVIGLIAVYPTGAVAVIHWLRKRGKLGARISSRFTKPAVKVAGWFVALWAGALFGSVGVAPLTNTRIWWFAVIALAVYFVPVMLYTWLLKKVESGEFDKDPLRSR